MDATKQIEAQSSVVLQGKELLVPAQNRFQFLSILTAEKSLFRALTGAFKAPTISPHLKQSTRSQCHQRLIHLLWSSGP